MLLQSIDSSSLTYRALGSFLRLPVLIKIRSWSTTSRFFDGMRTFCLRDLQRTSNENGTGGNVRVLSVALMMSGANATELKQLDVGVSSGAGDSSDESLYINCFISDHCQTSSSGNANNNSNNNNHIAIVVVVAIHTVLVSMIQQLLYSLQAISMAFACLLGAMGAD
jgi:hypothetical protein